MPTTLRLFLLLMFGMFGLQPVNYGYDAPTTLTDRKLLFWGGEYKGWGMGGG